MKRGVPFIVAAGATLVGWGWSRLATAEAGLRSSPVVLGESLFGMMLLGFIAVAGMALVEKAKPALWRAAIVLGAGIAGLSAGGGAGFWAARGAHALTLARAELILDAIDRHARTEGKVPQRLEELPPELLKEVPSTGYRGTFRYARSIGEYRLGFVDYYGLTHTFESATKRWRAE